VQKLDKVPIGTGPVGVEFKDVHFKYEERDVTVLGGVNLKVYPIKAWWDFETAP
jgi:hypothetical protein